MQNAVLPVLSTDEHLAKLLALPRKCEESVLAYYDHRIGGISLETRLMLLPLDDHLAHRGDGVFDNIKYVDGKLYGLDEHLNRLQSSAAAIFLKLPCSPEELRQIVFAVVVAAKERNGVIRILAGRGQGGFSIDPAECPEPSLFVIASKFTPKPDAWYAKGLTGFRTSIPAKQAYLSKIKSANYLPNVLMVREAREKGKDLPFCFDAEGYLAESAVSSIGIVDQKGCFNAPVLTNSLPGATLKRAMELLSGKVPSEVRRITEEELFSAKEIIMLGTSPDCASVVEYEGKPVADGKPGPVCALLRDLIRQDIAERGVPVPGLAMGK